MNTLRTVALMTVLTLLLVWAGGMMGGRGGALFALIMAAVMNLGSYWFSDKIVIAMYRGREVSSGPLFSVVQELCLRNALPMPKVYILPQATPNAFATGRNPKHAAVAATEGILQVLSREELMGVMAHEMSHVRHRDILIGSIAATIAGAISYLAHMAQWAALFGGFGGRDDDDGNPLGLLLLIIFAPLAAMLVQMAISRSREYAADRGGAALCGNPHYLANALRKLEMANSRQPMPKVNEATAHMFIVNPLRGGGLKSLFSTHPPVDERIRRLENMTVL
ncbi:membrane-bound zinc-dependent protease HtpX [Syntrophotalea carbinolica DSM 2380]|uniref:Protease HtpX homolog n=1 Tax=Syntrophotalea carbinolica (strain DSM 2380 / NBRC 103641 / GraBd1) TaxID=338963 RepID=HTPX_SYNC1|nr:zinc metalloprotease HtpX [Syntrophotalea carbinolica]Q3A7Y9.1 RecName: Full=Protease HtpX homolog [Syntrophotalea carbinolica DSM 2380]ABA87503.1 membrane-bound zinc-dependent protease HtpX [Syntrophotalea carbinolica DSM 2380]